MKVYLVSKRQGYEAVGEYDFETKKMIVKKGSQTSKDVAESATFRGTKTISALREKYVKDFVVTEDVYFNSASTAANFITGRSTNGLLAWKDKNNQKLKDLIKE